MSDFSIEPVIGHHVEVERYQPETIIEGIRERDERIRVTVGDVAWKTTSQISMTLDTFEKIIEWYEETR